VSFTVTSPLEVFDSILSTNGLFLENMYMASGFSLQASKIILALIQLISTAHTVDRTLWYNNTDTTKVVHIASLVLY